MVATPGGIPGLGTPHDRGTTTIVHVEAGLSVGANAIAVRYALPAAFGELLGAGKASCREEDCMPQGPPALELQLLGNCPSTHRGPRRRGLCSDCYARYRNGTCSPNDVAK